MSFEFGLHSNATIQIYMRGLLCGGEMNDSAILLDIWAWEAVQEADALNSAFHSNLYWARK